MERIRRAIYIGRDEAYLTEVQTTFSAEDEIFYYLQSIESPISFINAILDVIPNMIMVDITEFDRSPEDVERFLYIMRMLKSSNSIGSCLYVAIFESKEHRNKYSFLFSLGFNVGVIKTDDLSLYNDFSYIVGSPNFIFTPYATARFDLIKYMGKVQIDIQSLTDSYLFVSSDIPIEEWQEDIVFKIFDDYNVTYYDQIRLEGGCVFSDYLYSYAMMFPYAGPNEELTDDSLFPEMIETWMDLNKSRMIIHQGAAMIISVDINYVQVAQSLSEKYDMDLFYYRYVDEDENPIVEILPDIIIVDIRQMEESGTSIKKIVETIESVEAYQPMLITFGNLSTSEATQKAFSYFNILAVKEDICSKFIDQLVGVYKKSGKVSSCESVTRFKLTDPRRVGKLDLPIEVTSISEQFITFASRVEIPFFTNIFFDQPCDIVAIIVPAFKELEAMPGRKHYMALIHSYGHGEKQKLRRFVNQCIFNPPDEFVYKDIEIEKDEGYFARPVDAEGNVIEENVEREETKAESASKHFKNNKIVVGGKSKL